MLIGLVICFEFQLLVTTSTYIRWSIYVHGTYALVLHTTEWAYNNLVFTLIP